MKFKFKHLLLPAAALGLAAAPVLTATSCSNIDHLFFTIKNDKGLEIQFCDVGASIYSMKLDDTYLTYHQKDKNQFINREAKTYFHGKTLGRVTGRFKDGKMKFNGKEYQLEVNETGYPKNNCLHGGTHSFVYKDFKHYIYEDSDAIRVAFNYFSPADEANFPEAIDAWIVYKLYKKENKLDTDLYALPTGKTVINLCTHPLFTLANSGDILDYNLIINTDTRVKYEDESNKDKNGQIPEKTESVTLRDGIFDFSGSGKKIGKDIEAAKKYDPVSGGYDHIWAFDEASAVNSRFVQLSNDKLTFKVTATTPTITGVILYANDYPLKDTKMQPDGEDDRTYAGITIEPYTYFTGSNLDPITYTPEKPFHNGYTYEWTKK